MQFFSMMGSAAHFSSIAMASSRGTTWPMWPSGRKGLLGGFVLCSIFSALRLISRPMTGMRKAWSIPAGLTPLTGRTEICSKFLYCSRRNSRRL